MEKIETKEDLFRLISKFSNLGVLGLFIGSGFTKAVVHNPEFKAYSWTELITECGKKMNIDVCKIDQKCSCPELASRVCRKYVEDNHTTYEQATELFKNEIGQLTHIYPYKIEREKYESWFKTINPSWILTTNYDTVIESIFGGRALSLTPEDSFCKVNGLVSVFHIHGIYSKPESIVITDEDYKKLFRPFEYRQLRLPFLFKESCVLMIGYRLGDFNVSIAVDWAKDVFKNANPMFTNTVIQLVHRRDGITSPEPYYDEKGTIMYDFENLEDFLGELCEFMEKEKESYKNRTEEVEKNIKELLLPDKESLRDYLNNYDEKTRPIIMFFSELEREFGYAYNSLLNFVREAIIELDKMSAPRGEFVYYGVKLKLILDLLIHVPILNISPSLFATLASELAKLNTLVRKNGEKVFGTSYYASEIWVNNKTKIPKDVLSELRRFANLGDGRYSGIKNFLNSIPEANIETQ